MAAESLLYMSYLGIVLVIGLLCTIISTRLKIPNYLLLIATGIILDNLSYQGNPIISFPHEFINSIAVLALVMVVFDASSRLKLKEFDSLSTSAFVMGLVFFILNSIVISTVAFLVVGTHSFWLALLFATMISGTAPSVILSVLKNKKAKVFELLEIESIINTPLVVLIPFLILDFMQDGGGLALVGSQLVPFAQQFVAAIGTGVILGLIFFKFMKKNYNETISPLAMMTIALLTYVVAEQLGGNGVLAVTTAGIFFGNIFMEGKRKLQEFSSTVSSLLIILVFILIGLVIRIPFNPRLFIEAGYLFGISILVRFLSIHTVFATDKTLTFKEKVFMSLNIPKGIAVAVVALSFATAPIMGIIPVLNLVLVFMIYSIVVSTVATHFSKYFTAIDILEEPQKPKTTKTSKKISKKKSKRSSNGFKNK